MRPHLLKTTAVAATVFAALSLVTPAQANGVDVNDPSVPVLYPNGQYLSPQQVFAMYSGPGLSVILSDAQLRPLGPVVRTPSGPNEIEDFNSQLVAKISANGGPNDSTSVIGPMELEAFGKVGHVTGTFNTEMLQLNLFGSSAIYGNYAIRESPTLASTGQTTITDIGGGLYHIDSFFDVFTELSVDGGNSWIPSQGSTHVDLVSAPEPSVCALAGLAGLLALAKARRSGKPN